MPIGSPWSKNSARATECSFCNSASASTSVKLSFTSRARRASATRRLSSLPRPRQRRAYIDATPPPLPQRIVSVIGDRVLLITASALFGFRLLLALTLIPPWQQPDEPYHVGLVELQRARLASLDDCL